MPDDEKRTYQSVTLGLPPLQMVLVQAENERQNQVAQIILEAPEIVEKHKKQKAVTRLIKHLNEKSST